MVGRHQDLNSGSPENESNMLPLCHLARWHCFCFAEYYNYHRVKEFAVLVWLMQSKFLICTLIWIFFARSFTIIYFNLVFVIRLLDLKMFFVLTAIFWF